ncbi:MAG: MATE family efflux transporter, partial [Huintestinicola sp.]
RLLNPQETFMKELTTGNPTKILLAFALPIMIGSLFQQFYSMIDTVIVGRIIGVGAIAALGSTSYVSNLIIGFMSGLTNGFAIVTARHYGAGDHVKMRRAVSGTIILGLFVSVIFTIISMLLLEPFLRILNTPEDIFDEAYSYISIILIFMTTAMLYNMSAGVLRAVGDSITPLVFLVFSSFVNIALDFLFVAKLGFGVRGAAYATVISQSVSFILCLFYIFKRFSYLIPSADEFKVTLEELWELLSMGLSLAMMFSIVEVGSLVLQSAINNFGTDTIAAHTAARKISSILMLPFAALGSASATYCSQNIGAQKPERVGAGIKSAVFMAWIWSAAAVIIGWLLSPFIVRFIAGSGNDYIIETASKYMRVNTPFYFVLAVLAVTRSSLQGLGRKAVPVASSIIELIGKAVVAFLAAPALGYFGIMISEPIVWIFMTILLVIGYAKDKELVAETFPQKI